MQAYVLHGIHDLRLESRPERNLASNEVRIAVRRVGICGSDIHYYNHFRIGSFVPQGPLVLGHEFAGDVVEAGEDVASLSVGDRVTAEPSIECRHCRYCREGRYNLCTGLRFIGTAATIPHIDGAFGEHVVMPEDHCYRLGDDLDYATGALMEPLAVGMNAVRRAGPVVGRRVLVTGGGTIGQMVIAAARAAGATDITVSDPSPFAREASLHRGATDALDPSDEGRLETVLSGEGYDIVFEASGNPKALDFAYRATRRGGRIVQIGTLPDEVPVPANLVMSRELTVYGSFRYAHVFPAALDLLRHRRINLDGVISAVYKHSAFPEAMEHAASGTDVIKVQVEH